MGVDVWRRSSGDRSTLGAGGRFTLRITVSHFSCQNAPFEKAR